MKKLPVSLAIGSAAGTADCIPMLLQKIDRYSTISAFIFWVVMGVVISYSALPLKNWLKGMLIGFLSALPVMILVVKDDPRSVIPMCIMSLALGSLVGYLTGKFAHE